MDTLEMMQVYCRVVESGSFTRTAEQMNLSKAAVSKYIRELEGRLDARLLNRTTRSISATETGELYYERSLSILNQLEMLETDILALQKNVRGHLRVTMPTTFGEMFILPHLQGFLDTYPELSVDILLSDQFISLVDEHRDMAIRIGYLEDSSLIARPLGNMNIRLCASPVYIEQYGIPEHPKDLQQHRLIYDSNLATGNWHFKDTNGNVYDIPVVSRVKINSARAVREMMLRGEGIGYCPSFAVDDCLQRGSLVQLLPEYTRTRIPLSAIYPQARHISEKARVFSQFVAGLIERL